MTYKQEKTEVPRSSLTCNQENFLTLVYFRRNRRDRGSRLFCGKTASRPATQKAFCNSNPVSAEKNSCKATRTTRPAATHLVHFCIQGLIHFYTFCRVSGGCHGTKLHSSQCLTPTAVEKSVDKHNRLANCIISNGDKNIWKWQIV